MSWINTQLFAVNHQLRQLQFNRLRKAYLDQF